MGCALKAVLESSLSVVACEKMSNKEATPNSMREYVPTLTP